MRAEGAGSRRVLAGRSADDISDMLDTDRDMSDMLDANTGMNDMREYAVWP